MKQNIPNILTLGRIACLPLLLMLIYNDAYIWPAFVLYTLCAVTDWLDGYLARKWDVKSAFGTFLDPIADKVFVACILLVLVDDGTLSGVWVIPVLAIFIREFLISGLREYLGPKNIQMPVTSLAKWKTALQMVALGALILAPLSIGFDMGGKLLLALAALLTVITGWMYLQAGLKHL